MNDASNETQLTSNELKTCFHTVIHIFMITPNCIKHILFKTIFKLLKKENYTGFNMP